MLRIINNNTKHSSITGKFEPFIIFIFSEVLLLVLSRTFGSRSWTLRSRDRSSRPAWSRQNSANLNKFLPKIPLLRKYITFLFSIIYFLPTILVSAHTPSITLCNVHFSLSRYSCCSSNCVHVLCMRLPESDSRFT